MKLQAEFLLSATHEQQFPAPSVPEIAFLGRSNVGKSSLINALLGSHQARVSSTPGRTRAINFFALRFAANKPPVMLFADLPGYGYAKIAKSVSAQWPAFIEPYLAQRPTLALSVCLVDSNIAPQASDAHLQQALRRWQRASLVVATKADKLSNNALRASLGALQSALQTDRVLPCSAIKKTGLKEVWAQIAAASQV